MKGLFCNNIKHGSIRWSLALVYIFSATFRRSRFGQLVRVREHGGASIWPAVDCAHVSGRDAAGFSRSASQRKPVHVVPALSLGGVLLCLPCCRHPAVAMGAWASPRESIHGGGVQSAH